MKKQELKVKYELIKNKNGWQVIDVAVLGDSMLKGIRDDQIIRCSKRAAGKKCSRRCATKRTK